MEMLLEVLRNLLDGEPVDIEHRVNQHGINIATGRAYLAHDGIVFTRMCWDNDTHGFGTCQCQSHNLWRDYQIDTKELLFLIYKLIKDELEQTKESAKAEKALTRLINELS